MSSNIFDNLHTTDDALRLEEELNLLKNSVYKNGKSGSFVDILQTKVSESTSDAISSLLSGSFENSDMINSQIDELLDELKSITIITLKIGFEPSYAQIANISIHACQISGKKVLIDIYFDPQIVSGAEIIADGKFYDGTTNKNFNQALFEQTKTVPREGDFLIGRLK